MNVYLGHNAFGSEGFQDPLLCVFVYTPCVLGMSIRLLHTMMIFRRAIVLPTTLLSL